MIITRKEFENQLDSPEWVKAVFQDYRVQMIRGDNFNMNLGVYFFDIQIFVQGNWIFKRIQR